MEYINEIHVRPASSDGQGLLPLSGKIGRVTRKSDSLTDADRSRIGQDSGRISDGCAAEATHCRMRSCRPATDPAQSWTNPSLPPCAPAGGPPATPSSPASPLPRLPNSQPSPARAPSGRAPWRRAHGFHDRTSPLNSSSTLTERYSAQAGAWFGHAARHRPGLADPLQIRPAPDPRIPPSSLPARPAGALLWAGARIPTLTHRP